MCNMINGNLRIQQFIYRVIDTKQTVRLSLYELIKNAMSYGYGDHILRTDLHDYVVNYELLERSDICFDITKAVDFLLTGTAYCDFDQKIDNTNIILEYCQKFQSNNIEELQKKKDVIIALTDPSKKRYLLHACPGTCGMDKFVGECIKNPISSDKDTDAHEVEKMCLECWDNALYYFKIGDGLNDN